MSAAGPPIQGVEVSWARTRELFSLDRRVAHLNHGSFGAVPIPVQRAQQRLRDEMDANPMAFFTRGLGDRIAHTRRHLAAFLGADPLGTALVPNITAGVQVVLGSLDLSTGDEVLVTDHGYGTVRWAVERTGAAVREIRIPLAAGDDEIVATIAAAARPGRTRLAVVDHIAAATAMLAPIPRIVAALRERGVATLVDAAHAPGMLGVDVAASGADFWVGTLHKWAFAPRPTAVLVVDRERVRRVRPLVVSWAQPEGFPAAVEHGGTLDYTAWLAAPTGIHLLRTLGPDAVRRHNAELAGHGQRVLARALGVEPVPGSAQVSMRLVPLPPGVGHDLVAAVTLRTRIAADLRCEVATTAWNGHGYLRVSAQIYNRAEEYERLAERLPALLARAAR